MESWGALGAILKLAQRKRSVIRPMRLKFYAMAFDLGSLLNKACRSCRLLHNKVRGGHELKPVGDPQNIAVLRWENGFSCVHSPGVLKIAGRCNGD
jgi:hypothetical protein